MYRVFLLPALLGAPGCNSSESQAQDPYIMVWSIGATDGINLKVTGGTAFADQKLSPKLNDSVNAGYPYQYVLFDKLDVGIYSGADGGGQLLNSTTIQMTTSEGNTYPLDEKNLIKLTYNSAKSTYGASAWDNRNWFDITYNAVAPPSVVTNSGWASGMGNTSSEATSGQSFWLADYGDEQGRWSVSDGAIYQSTEPLSAQNVGSRAYPAMLTQEKDSWSYTAAPGVAMDGLWQIDIKIGSDGKSSSLFCETFYLAERANLQNSTANYLDDSSKGGSGGYGREIDIMETKWNGGSSTKTGPQLNLPNGGSDKATQMSWSVSSKYVGYLGGEWADNGGAPAKEFSTFGALIRDNTLWIYAYKTDGTIWYSTDAIPMDNPGYNQKHPFVPYIGTWSGQHAAGGGFKTGYNNFIYLKADDSKIAGKNPKDHPEAFGAALKK